MKYWNSFIVKQTMLNTEMFRKNINLSCLDLIFRNNLVTRRLIQVLDCLLLDLSMYGYEMGLLVLSSLYVVAKVKVLAVIKGTSFEKFSYGYMGATSKKHSLINEDKFGFDAVFKSFLHVFEVELEELVEPSKLVVRQLSMRLPV